MIKKLLLIVTALFTNFCFAQNSVNVKPDLHYTPKAPSFITFNGVTTFSNNDETKRFLEINFLNKGVNGQMLVLEKKSNSPAGKHLRFIHQLNGLQVFQSFIQANYTHDGKLYSVIDALVHFDKLSIENVSTNSQFWINTTEGLIPAYQSCLTDPITNKPVTTIHSAGGILLFSFDPRLYFYNPDSTVTAMVYMPNPLVTANTNYGGKYIDNNDQTNDELNNTRVKVRVPLTFINGKFKLTDGILTIKNLHDPAFDPIQPTDTFLNFTRNQSGFEDINVFYHLKTYSDYLRIRGFGDLLDSIHVDSHGSNGGDDSFFDPSKYPYQIEYGTGNVDDGEDGQVVIHEFGHSLSVIAAPSTVFGRQRIAMEEGQADYLAMSYSRSLSNNRPNDVFSWDGHNEFWSGFVTNTSRKYKDTTGIKDIDREIWSTALMCIYDKLGRNRSDSIILSSYFHQAAYGKMNQMARVILKMDSLLNKGKDVVSIWQCFSDRGILDTVPWNLIKINKPTYPVQIEILNTSDFAIGIAPLRIIMKNYYPSAVIELYNNMGQKIRVFEATNEIQISPEIIIPGVYYLKINSGDNKISYSKKIIRF